MAGRIKIPGFRNDILLNADEIMYAEVGGNKEMPYVAIYFNNADAVTQVGDRAEENPNGLIALNLYVKGYERAQQLLIGLNNALTGFGNGLTVVNHNYEDIMLAIWQVNNVSQSMVNPRDRADGPVLGK
jgi:hypothetical protein